jgi:adenylate cyclase
MDGIRYDGTAELLREREARSLTLLIGIGLVCFVALSTYLLIQNSIAPQTHIDSPRAAIYFAATIGLQILLLLSLRRRSWIEAVGVVAAVGCGTFAAITGYMMWRIYASGAPAAMLTKIPVAAAGLTMIALMTLTLRPLHVVIVGVGVAATLIGFYALAWYDPATTFASHSAEPYLGPAVSITRLIVELLCVTGATTGAAIAVFFARRTVGEAVTLQRTTDQLSRYFSPEVATGIRTGADSFQRPGGREQEVVVMFSDLAGFTSTCAGLSATEALTMLSEYQECMVTEIFRAGGTLDKFIGDGIMATFGTPAPAADAADRAVRAARGMLAALAELNLERVARGHPPLKQRSGIHAGLAVVGNVGTRQRLEFTVIGNTVNVAKRIENACKKTGKTLMISADVVARLVQTVALEPVGPVALEGLSEPFELYALAPKLIT